MANWTTEAIPPQAGRTAIITGANTGLGFETALALAAHGARVVLAVRNVAKGEQAADRIKAQHSDAVISVQPLDLSSLDSVRAAAAQLGAARDRIDLLINNAGVMYTPKQLTRDGFELHFGTNHLGHFALTGLLLPHLLPVEGSRVLTLSSLAHKVGADIHFADLQLDCRYTRIKAYAQAKLANLLFTYELQDRLTAAHANTISLAAHPGMSNTELNRNMPAWMAVPFKLFGPLTNQSGAMGALGTLRAATDPAARGGQFYGPPGAGTRGYPVAIESSAKSHDAELQRRLWAVSEELTGVSFPLKDKAEA